MYRLYSGFNRTEKRNLEEDMQSLCQEADDRLNEFSDTLHLECLEMYKSKNGEFSDNEKNDVTELPQVSTYFNIVIYFY